MDFSKGQAVPTEEDVCSLPMEEPMDGLCTELSTLVEMPTERKAFQQKS